MVLTRVETSSAPSLPNAALKAGLAVVAGLAPAGGTAGRAAVAGPAGLFLYRASSSSTTLSALLFSCTAAWSR